MGLVCDSSACCAISNGVWFSSSTWTVASDGVAKTRSSAGFHLRRARSGEACPAPTTTFCSQASQLGFSSRMSCGPCGSESVRLLTGSLVRFWPST